jgi:type III restriction enzyme
MTAICGRTTRDVREVVKSHVNLVVADAAHWEQSAAYAIDSHPSVATFAKNAALGFAIPYLANGEPHDCELTLSLALPIATTNSSSWKQRASTIAQDSSSQAAQRW